MPLRRTRKRAKDGQTITDRYSIEQIEKALRAADGHLSKAAKKLACSVKTLKHYLTRYEHLEDVLEEIDDELIDLAESGMKKHIKAKNLDAIKYYLERKGKKRGYVKQTEVAGVTDKPLKLTIVPATGYKDEED